MFQATRTFPTACIPGGVRSPAGGQQFQATRTFPTACIPLDPIGLVSAAVVSGDTNFSNGLHRKGSTPCGGTCGFQATRTFPTACIPPEEPPAPKPDKFQATRTFPTACIQDQRGRHAEFRRVSGDTNFSNGLHRCNVPAWPFVIVFQATRTFPTACIPPAPINPAVSTCFRRHELFQRPASRRTRRMADRGRVSGDTNFSNGLHRRVFKSKCAHYLRVRNREPHGYHLRSDVG